MAHIVDDIGWGVFIISSDKIEADWYYYGNKMGNGLGMGPWWPWDADKRESTWL